MVDNNTPIEKVCSGDCLQCNKTQQLYCASQGNIEIHRSVKKLIELVNTLIDKTESLANNVDTISKFVEEFNKPISMVKKGKAPKSSGADN